MMRKPWTKATIARLRRLWAEGSSTAEIGAALGVPAHAIDGAAILLGLPDRRTTRPLDWRVSLSKNLLGQTFDRLTVLRHAGRSNRHRGARWICRCACGTASVEVEARSLLAGRTRSCGCLFKEWNARQKQGKQ